MIKINRNLRENGLILNENMLLLSIKLFIYLSMRIIHWPFWFSRRNEIGADWNRFVYIKINSV
jgi:hypothetical protein